MQLSEAFEIKPSDIVAIVGGGGKTTLLYRLAHEIAVGGGRAVASGTTLFTPPQPSLRLPTVVEPDEEKLVEQAIMKMADLPAIIAATGHGTKGRFLPISRETPCRFIARAPDACVFVEADGSRGRPFKAPDDHEPVIPDAATLVIAVAGMSALGAPLDEEHVHRPQRVMALTGAAEGSPVTHEMMAAVLADPLGSKKGVEAGTRFVVVLNQVAPPALNDARRIGHLLRAADVEVVVLAQARSEDPVVEVMR